MKYSESKLKIITLLIYIKRRLNFPNNHNISINTLIINKHYILFIHLQTYNFNHEDKIIIFRGLILTPQRDMY